MQAPELCGRFNGTHLSARRLDEEQLAVGDQFARWAE